MNEKINEALDRIPDAYIQEASGYKKRRLPRYFGALAAVLALIILVAAINPMGGSPINPTETVPQDPTYSNPHTPSDPIIPSIPIPPISSGSKLLLAAPSYPKMAPYRDWGEEGFEAWQESQKAQYDQPMGYADNLIRFFRESIPEFLAAAEGENAVCSPVNVYMALAMLAECAAGNSRKQILNLLGAESIEALRVQAGHVWNAHYRDDKLVKLLMANSLWLDNAYSFKQNTVDILANNYYASVFQGDLGTEEANRALRDWVNLQTGGLLKEQADSLVLSPDTVFALASTIEYRVDWEWEFSEKQNIEAIFHGTAGDTAATYMQKSLSDIYYAGENFGAMYLRLQDGNRMWLILPDSGTTPQALLNAGTVLDMAGGNMENVQATHIIINLSLPKFDAASQSDLVKAVMNLGVTDVFHDVTSDFSSIVDQTCYVDQIRHAARVTIDEEGVVAAGFTVIPTATDSEPPKEEIDFVLDRPFLFVITSQDGLPLFTGIVNQA